MTHSARQGAVCASAEILRILHDADPFVEARAPGEPTPVSDLHEISNALAGNGVSVEPGGVSCGHPPPTKPCWSAQSYRSGAPGRAHLRRSVRGFCAERRSADRQLCAR
jgi:hypothetical protein